MALIIINVGCPTPEAVEIAQGIDGNSPGGWRIRVTEEKVPDTLEPQAEGVWCDGCAGHEAGPPGVRWPTAANGDDSRSWVERCDTCNRYTTDEEAAQAVREQYSEGDLTAFGSARPAGSSSLTPFVEVG